MFLCIVHIIEKILFNDWNNQYERSEDVGCDDQSWRYCSLGNMFGLLKYGGNQLKMKSHSQVLSQASLYKIWQELLSIYWRRRLKMRTRIIIVPGERWTTGLSRAWPGWCLAENLQESFIWGIWYQGTGLNDAQNGYHSPPGAAKVTVWKNLEVLVYSRNRPMSLQTLNNLDDRAAGPGIKVYRSKDFIWTEHLKLARCLASGGNS